MRSHKSLLRGVYGVISGGYHHPTSNTSFKRAEQEGDGSQDSTGRSCASHACRGTVLPKIWVAAGTWIHAVQTSGLIVSAVKPSKLSTADV